MGKSSPVVTSIPEINGAEIKMCFWLQDWMALGWALYCIMKHLEGADYILHLQIKIFFTHLNSFM
jgi:hypothetical protein